MVISCAQFGRFRWTGNHLQATNHGAAFTPIPGPVKKNDADKSGYDHCQPAHIYSTTIKRYCVWICWPCSKSLPTRWRTDFDSAINEARRRYGSQTVAYYSRSLGQVLGGLFLACVLAVKRPQVRAVSEKLVTSMDRVHSSFRQDHKYSYLHHRKQGWTVNLWPLLSLKWPPYGAV